MLADHLLAMGDPRGQLAALQLAPDSPAVREAEDRFRFDHRDALLGPMAASEQPWRVVWRHGFVVELSLVVDGMGEAQAAWIAALVDRGALRLLQALRLVGSANYDAVARELLRHDWPLLDTLTMGPLNLGAGRLDVPVQELLDRMPALRALRVEQPGTLGRWRHASLERLTVSARPDQLASFALDGLPAVRALRLYTRDATVGPVLDRALVRPLAELALHGGLVQAWLAAPHLPAPELLVLYEVAAGAVARARADPRAARVVAGRSESADRDPLLTPPEQARLRRFERDGRFWEVRRDGSSLALRYGRGAGAGTRRELPSRSAYDAARAYRERVTAKRDEGFHEVWLPPERWSAPGAP